MLQLQVEDIDARLSPGNKKFDQSRRNQYMINVIPPLAKDGRGVIYFHLFIF